MSVRPAGALALMSFLLASCASGPPKGNDLGPKPIGIGFPSQSPEDPLYFTARFDADHRKPFDVDLIERKGVLPVHLSIELSSKADPRLVALLSDAVMEPRLYLADGAVLYPVKADDVAKDLKEKQARAVREHAFRGDLLRPGEKNENYLFFRLAPEKELHYEDGEIYHERGGVVARMDATQSLLAFQVVIDDRPRTFYVGLSP